MGRHFLSLKLVGNASIKEATQREKAIQESVDWLESVSSFASRNNLPPSKIKAIDKTYLTTSPWHNYVRHIGPRGSTKSRKVTSERGTGIISIVFLQVISFGVSCFHSISNLF